MARFDQFWAIFGVLPPLDILPPMSTMLLVRHALTPVTGRLLAGTAEGIPLSGEGREQARELAERLAPVRLAAIYSSPLERCVETAQSIANGRRVKIRFAPELREVDYGRWTGRPLAQLARTRLWREVHHMPSSVRFPGGETLREVQERGVRALDAIAARHHRGPVAVVTHGDVIRLVLAHYAGIHIDLFQRLVIHPASVSAVALRDGTPHILRMNDTGTFGPGVRG